MALKATKQANQISQQAMQGLTGFHFSSPLSAKAKEDLINIAMQLQIMITENENKSRLQCHLDEMKKEGSDEINPKEVQKEGT